MKRYIALLLVAITVGRSAYADCPNPVTLLDQNQPAPCRGYLFTPDKERSVYLINESYKLLQDEDAIKDKKIADQQTENTNLQTALTAEQQKSQLWQTKAEDSTQKLMQADDSRGRRDMLFIGLGIALTVLSGWAIGQAAKH